MTPGKKNSYNSLSDISVAGKDYKYYSLKKAEENGLEGISKLPKSLKVLLENLLRYEDDLSVNKNQINSIKDWLKTKKSNTEIAYRPARVLLQDYTGIPAVADLAAMRDAVKKLGGDPDKINPLNPVDLVIDHSVMIDEFGNARAFQMNVDREYERNLERYTFLKWGQSAFNNFRVVPPGTGICHQVNLEYLSKTVWSDEDQFGKMVAYPDTLVGTDSHTTMVNGLGVLGWGVGGIEAEAALLGQPVSMLIPRVVGFKLTGALPLGTTATDMALTITEILRKVGVVGKFVEFFGPGVTTVPMANRTTIGNMSPEYGSTCAIFPIDEETLRYLRLTGRSDDQVALVEQYAKKQGMWHDPSVEPRFSQVVELDLSTVVPSISGPKRPQDRVELSNAGLAFESAVQTYTQQRAKTANVSLNGENFDVAHGSVVIAAITSCTRSSASTTVPSRDFILPCGKSTMP